MKPTPSLRRALVWLACASPWPLLAWAADAARTEPASAPASAPSPATSSAPTIPSPLSQDEAVRLALQRSPALRALQARSEAQAAQALADARPGLFGLSLARLKQGDDTEIDRHLSLGLLDLVLWPWRSAAADQRIDLAQQARALAVLQHAQAVRAQWVMAVAAQARERYLADSLSAALTAAELARRLQATGQFSTAQRDRRAASAAQARLTQAVATRQARHERETLVQLLGLRGDEARHLTLPDALPPLPSSDEAPPPSRPLWTEDRMQQAAREGRLDVRLAESRWRASRGQARADIAHSLVDVDVGIERNNVTSEAAQHGATLDLRLISIDLGAARREAVQQQEQAALAAWEQQALIAESQLRERWADYVAAQTTARDATEVLQALRHSLLDERLKQYNGMLVGPLELLDEARAHGDSVLTALDALRDFWLADAALQAAVEGTDMPADRSTPSSPEADTP